jgi:hypothetical protein
MFSAINKINVISFSGKSWRNLSIFSLFILFPALSLSAQKNKLTRFCQETPNGIVCGYLNKGGDTIVQAGKYNNLPEKIKKPLIVQCTGESNKWVMINNDALEMYRIYAFGGDPDSFNEGLLRIIQDDKIGFINRKGQIIISPEYCQATPFFKGKSIVNVNATKVDKSATDTQNSILWEGGNWGVIDTKGNVVKSFEYSRMWNDSIETYEYRCRGEIFIFTQKGEIKAFTLVD